MKRKLKKMVAVMLMILAAIMCIPQTVKASEGYSIQLVKPYATAFPRYSVCTPTGAIAEAGWYLINDIYYYQASYGQVVQNDWIDNKYYVDIYGGWCSNLSYTDYFDSSDSEFLKSDIYTALTFAETHQNKKSLRLGLLEIKIDPTQTNLQ